MYLKDLTINGFKSFAKKSELEFSTPITAIVGPNGSGKSNVAESFRFVLGEQSVKSLRGKKGEDLIWGGSDSVSRGNRASVVVTLSNEKRVFPVDFDEVVLERVVHRDGQNEYSVNGSKVRLKDVQELLASANIGPTGHHIISQGEADRILSANPRERREMIEDALGLKVYQFKKQEAERKLKKTKENSAQVESLRREVAPHLKFLERQMKKIERSLELQKELQCVYAEYLRREDVYIAHHSDRLRALRGTPENTLQELRSAHEKAKSKLEAKEDDEKRRKLIEVEGKLAVVRAQHQELIKKSGQLEGQISFLQRRIEEAERKQHETEAIALSYGDVDQVVSSVEQAVERAKKSEEVSMLRRALEDVVHTMRTFLTKAKEKDAPSMSSEQNELSNLEKEKVSIEIDLEAAAKEEEALQSAYNDVRGAIEADASESRDAERELFRIVGEERECERELADIDAELVVLERERNEFKRELQEAVSLIGRGAASYFSCQIFENGEEIGPEGIVAEDRGRQHERRRELEKMKIRLEELGSGDNQDVVKEYNEVKERDAFLERELGDLGASVEKLEALIGELNAQLDEQFVSGIEKIGKEFNTFFTLMFGGGEAKLEKTVQTVKRRKKENELLNDDDTVAGEVGDEEGENEAGIELDVKLPNKRVKGLEMLSGGERALTSIALIFAMSQVNPPLFIILDETDAALDEANSRRYGDMIEALAKKSQLILITHNRETMSRAGILYGVTMSGDGVSKLLSVKLDEAVTVAK